MRHLTLTCFSAALLCVAPVQAALAFETKATQAMMVDATTNTLLLSKDATSKMYPSSMSKLMTLYMLFEALKQGGITLDSTFPVSEKAWKKGGSKMFVKVNTEVRVEDLIRGIIVQSGNDACIVVAEALAGSEEAFARNMTEKGKEIGLQGSKFANSTGWPDSEHYMTAADLITLSRRLSEDFPELYDYFVEKEYTYSGITQPNRNTLLEMDLGVDGLKTGHTEAAGYGIAVSATQPETQRRLYLVVNGLSSMKERISEARRLLEYGYRNYMVQTLKQAETPIALVDVWMGAEESVPVGLSQPLEVSVPRDEEALTYTLEASEPLQAPVKVGQPVGMLTISRGDQPLKVVPVFALQEVDSAGFITQFWRKLLLTLGL